MTHARAVLLYVFSSRSNERRFLETVGHVMGNRCSYVMTQSVPEFHHGFRPPPLLSGLFALPWRRAVGHVGFRIGLA